MATLRPGTTAPTEPTAPAAVTHAEGASARLAPAAVKTRSPMRFPCRTPRPTARLAVPLVLLTAALLGITPIATANEAWEHDPPERILDDLKHPVDIAFGGDGHLYYAALSDTEIRRIDLETGTLDEGFTVRLPDASWENGSETGLFGIALDPDFHANGILYVSYTRHDEDLPDEEAWTNVLSRLTLLDPSGAVDEEVLLTRPGFLFHNGGRLLLQGDHIFWTTGDASDWQQDPMVGGQVAQDEEALNGKVLRLDLDGNPAPGNPWGNEVYTMGHRNVFGIAWDPDAERILVTENGNARADYIYILEAGNNHGWPECEGRCAEERPEYTDPIWESKGTVAPTGAGWFRGAYWFGTFNQGDLFRVHEDEEGWQVVKVHHTRGTEDDPPRILDVEAGPDGQTLWYSTWNEVWRIDYRAHDDWPRIEARAGGPYWWETGDGDGPTGGQADDATGTAPGPGVLALIGLLAFTLIRAHRSRHR